MTDYVKSTNFASKDSLAAGNPLKIVKGTEIDTEFNNIATAVATKANSVDVTSAIDAATGTIAIQDSNNVTITGGSISGITDLAVADGGTGASTASGARTNLGVAIGTDVMPYVTPGTAGNVLISDGTNWTSANPSTPVNVQTFNSTGTWTKPAGYTMARVQLWGGGGGGGKAATSSYGGGGGGGGYNEITVPLSYLAASFTVTVGAGGAGAVGASTPGAAGGQSSVPLATAINGRSTIDAYGGGGGGSGAVGGGGGGQLSAGTNTGVPGNYGAGTEGSGIASGSGLSGFWVGGGGGGGTGFNGGGSVWGGGGGGGSGTGGGSTYGGAGGAGLTVGTAPGGGGGATNTTSIGYAGAAGRVVITCW